jgi:hypothetical protein
MKKAFRHFIKNSNNPLAVELESENDGAHENFSVCLF